MLGELVLVPIKMVLAIDFFSYNWVHPGYPFGGLKQSGFGYDLGPEAVLQEYTVSRTVFQSLRNETRG
jgi:acyl-CoA reductase-like NAD-dependent aldehyde dehydrogenase